MNIEHSHAERIALDLGRIPAAELACYLDGLGVVELAALRHDWTFWARPKQLPPATPWRSWGLCTGRGYGKTRSIAEYITAEVMAGRARRVALVAQNEDKTREVLVDGESGLVAVAPPWFRPEWEKNRLVWPNGAQAFPYTPEVPGALRGPEHDHAWASEVATWPASTRDEAFSNLRLGLRLGVARLLWDSTPKRRHLLIRYLLNRSKKHPARHIVVRGSTQENASNLPPEQLAEWIDEYGGTQRGREELDGEFFDDSDGALWRQDWIDRARRDMPTVFARRILSIDPAISDRKGTDATGIVDLGLGVDGQVFVVANLSGRHAWEAWGQLAVARYFATKCDCIVVERNRGGAGCTANLRAAARETGLHVEVVDGKAVTRHAAGTIYVKEVNSQQSKGARSAPVAHEYERGRVSHVNGGEGLPALENVLTTWEPEVKGQSPDALDAMVWGVWELAKLGEQAIDRGAGFVGIEKMSKALAASTRGTGSAASVMAALGRSEWGSTL